MWRRNQKQPLDSRAIFCSQKPPDEVINLFLEGCRLWGKAENTQSGVLLPPCVAEVVHFQEEEGKSELSFHFLLRPGLFFSSQMSSAPFSVLCNSTPDDSSATKTHVWIVTVKLSNLQTWALKLNMRIFSFGPFLFTFSTLKSAVYLNPAVKWGYFSGVTSFFWAPQNKKVEEILCFPSLSPFCALFTVCRQTSGHGVAPQGDLPLDLRSCSDIL